MSTQLGGTWPVHCRQRAFVDGAKWMMMQLEGRTMWRSERIEAEAEAVSRYGEPVAQHDTPTWRQLAMMRHIRDAVDATGRQPTIREIMAAFQMQSPNGVVSCIRAIVRKGLAEKHGRGKIVFTKAGIGAMAELDPPAPERLH